MLAVVILHDFCRLIVGNPQPELSDALQVVVEASLEAVAHSELGSEVMPFTQIVAVALLARQVPHDHVGVLP